MKLKIVVPIFLIACLWRINWSADRKVADVFGSEVYARQLTPSSAEFGGIKADYGMVSSKSPGTDEELMLEIQTGKLSEMILKNINDRITKTTNIEPTQTDLNEYKEATKGMRPGLPPSRPSEEDLRIQKEAEKETLQTIRTWKLHGALYAKYGGVVVGFPPFPVGAYRKLLDESAKKTDFTIHDEKLRAAFWKQFSVENRKDQVPKEKVDFSKPWWLQFKK